MTDTLLQRAGLLIQHRRFDEASTVLMQSLSQNPNDPETLRLLGICLFSKDDNKGALAAFQQAISADPEDAELRVWLARTQAELKQLDAAHRTLDEAQAMDPDFAGMHSTRSLLFYHQTKWAEAEKAAKAALELDADDLTAQNILSHALMMQGLKEESEAHIHQRFTRDPESEFTHIAAGYAALRRGDHAGATVHFSEALRLNPDSEGAREGLLTSFRARSLIYRSFLGFSFKVAQLQQKYRIGLFIGAYIVYKMVVTALRPDYPGLATAVIVLYVLFVFWTYVAQGIGTLVILGDRTARQALRPREQWEGLLVGGAAVAGLAIILASLIFGLPGGIFNLGLCLAAMSIPWSLSLGTRNRTGQYIYGTFAVLATAGVLMVGFGNIPDGSSTLRGGGMLLALACASIPTFLAVFGFKRS